MKKLLIVCVVICFSFSFNACTAEKNSNQNNKLVVYQDFDNDETGIVKATMTIQWSQKEISSMSHEDIYKTEKQAQTMFERLSAEFKKIPNNKLELNKKTITYDEVDISNWKELSYDDMVKLIKKDDKWKIKVTN